MFRSATLLAAVVIASLLVAVPLGSVSAACEPVVTSGAGATAAGNEVLVEVQEVVSVECSENQQAGASSPGTWHSEPVCELGGSATCVVPATCSDGTRMTENWFVAADGTESESSLVCPEEAEAAAPPVVITSVMVLRALRRVGLPESVVVVQPPGGRTLVNFETNFFTVAGEFSRVVRLAGQRVELRVWPSSFGWRFGDGQVLETAEAGSPFPDLVVTHAYRRAGPVAASVDTTYSAEFRVNGGGWQPVVGTVTAAGVPVGLEVVTAAPTLVGYQ